MKNKIIVGILAILLVITIGYALINTVMGIKGTAKIGSGSFSVHFDNVVISDDSIEPLVPVQINEEKNEIEFQVTFPAIGTRFEFTTDIVNDGSIDAKISKIELTDLSEAESHFLEQIMYYTDTEETPAIGDELAAGETKNLTIKVNYDLTSNLTNEEYDVFMNTSSKTFIVKITYEA